jgi:tetratricopeptide (TPR) repeat protein
MYWVARLRTGHIPAPAEPLSQRVWELGSWILRHLAAPVATLSFVSIACGLVSAILLWRIAGLIASAREERIAAFLLLFTMGSTQLFFGYIESYPVGATFLLGYLAVGLQAAKDRRAPVSLGLAYAGALAAHLAALYLAPSFLYLLLRAEAPRRRTIALLAGTALLSAAILILLGSTPYWWLHLFDIATRATRTGSLITVFSKPYGIVSVGHLADIGNELLLVLPVPLLLLLSAGLPKGEDSTERNFLVLSAAGGVLGLCLLVLPVAAAQDWDLMSMLLLPLGVLGVWAGRSFYGGGARPVRIAAVALGLATLLSFVLVNANERSALRRYETLVGPGARISSFGRWYAWESLAQYYRHQQRYDLAMEYVQRLIQSAPGNPRYWGMAGETLIGMARYDQAIPPLLKSLEMNPERAPARTNLGIAYSALGRYPEALEQFRDAVRLVDDNPDYHHNLGLAYWNVGARDSARTEWTSLLLRWPGYVRTRQALERYFPQQP